MLLTLPNYAQWELKPVFSTDFERESWLIECGNGTHIEVAFDQGKIVAGEKQTPICEVEFELKSGLPIDLLRFVQTLTLENELRLSSASKAKRLSFSKSDFHDSNELVREVARVSTIYAKHDKCLG